MLGPELVCRFVTGVKYGVDEVPVEIRAELGKSVLDGKTPRLPLRVARWRWGKRLTVASLSALVKRTTESGERVVRLLFDGTHGLDLNRRMRQRDAVTFPLAKDIARVAWALVGRGGGA